MRSHKWLYNRMPAAMAQLSVIQTFVHHLKTKWMSMGHIHRLPCIRYRRIDSIGRKACRDWSCRHSIGATSWRTFPAGYCHRKLAAKIHVWLVCLLPPYARWYRLLPFKLVRNTDGITALLESNFLRNLNESFTGGSTALIVLRVIVGAGEGFVFPSCSTLLAAWTPLKERSIAVSVVFSGGMIGSVIGSSCSGILIEQYGWTSVFYVFGTVSIVWCIVFVSKAEWPRENVIFQFLSIYNSQALICTNNPETHPFISEREKNYLQRELGQLKRRTDLPPTPWRAILTSVPMIALIVAQIGHNWGLFIVITDLPKYMNDVLRFSIKKNGLYTALPYLCLWIVGISSGFLSDYLIKRNHLSITFSRKLFTSIAAIGPAIFIIFASYAGCDRGAVVAMFTLGMGFMGTFYSGIKANAIDLAPNYAGVIMALANGLGGLTGVIGPYIVGLLTENVSFFFLFRERELNLTEKIMGFSLVTVTVDGMESRILDNICYFCRNDNRLCVVCIGRSSTLERYIWKSDYNRHHSNERSHQGEALRRKTSLNW